MIFLHDLFIFLSNPYFGIPIFLLLGACFASYFNVVSFRTPVIMESEDASQIKSWLEEKKIKVPENIDQYIKNNYNLSFPSSHCYTCGNYLAWYHNIPVLSYLFLKGKCGFCNTKLSIQYPIVELLGASLSLFVYFNFLSTNMVGFLFIYTFFMITFLLLLIDLKSSLLPDSYNYFLLWSGMLITMLGYNPFGISIQESILGVISIYTITFIISKSVSKMVGREAMGDGDLKLLAALGAILGYQGALFSLFTSPILGILFYLYFKFKKPENPEVPYGPALILTSWFYIIFTEQVQYFINHI
jgi:leader peptidase (prepilin peptidase)/N-methyltransferase